MKRCIFYLPYELDLIAARARMVRPRKMIQAFKDIGYEVFQITGYANERKEKIAELKKQIHAGAQFDFMYAEASTMPTLLTDPKHLPTHPLFDYQFFGYVKKHGIRIGLFYSDIFWHFEEYGKSLPLWKKNSALLCYKYDIFQYERLLDKFYVPTMKICQYLGSVKLSSIGEELPPGAEFGSVSARDYSKRDFSEKPLTLLYIGGLGGHYQIEELLKAVAMTDHCRLILCCRVDEWNKSPYHAYESGKIEVVHKSGPELDSLYAISDIGMLLFRRDYYMDMAKPVKAYEYLGHELPILATKGLDIADFVESAGIGWTAEYSAEAISEKLRHIISHPELINQVLTNTAKAKEENSWTARARQVCKGLTRKDDYTNCERRREI